MSKVEITEDLPDRVGGYATLEYLSHCGWRFAIVPADTDLFADPEVLVVGRRDGWPEIRAQARTVELAAREIWWQCWNTLGHAAALIWRFPEPAGRPRLIEKRRMPTTVRGFSDTRKREAA